jgi:hypothetical protein
MTIKKLARFIVEDWFDGSCGERFTYECEQEEKRLREQLQFQSNEIKVGTVYVDLE